MAKKINKGKSSKTEIPRIEETVSDILKSLHRDVYDSLMDLLQKTESSDEYVRQIFIGDCPVCGSEKTSDCDELPIEDITVGVCLKCFTFWCTECGTIFKKGQTVCDHWVLCEACDMSTDMGCGMTADECETIIRWKNKELDH
jgi:hypothetical protein